MSTVYMAIGGFIGIALIALLTLLVQAIFDMKTSDEARGRLWAVFWVGTIVGGVLF